MQGLSSTHWRSHPHLRWRWNKRWREQVDVVQRACEAEWWADAKSSLREQSASGRSEPRQVVEEEVEVEAGTQPLIQHSPEYHRKHRRKRHARGDV